MEDNSTVDTTPAAAAVDDDAMQICLNQDEGILGLIFTKCCSSFGEVACVSTRWRKVAARNKDRVRCQGHHPAGASIRYSYLEVFEGMFILGQTSTPADTGTWLPSLSSANRGSSTDGFGRWSCCTEPAHHIIQGCLGEEATLAWNPTRCRYIEKENQKALKAFYSFHPASATLEYMHGQPGENTSCKWSCCQKQLEPTPEYIRRHGTHEGGTGCMDYDGAPDGWQEFKDVKAMNDDSESSAIVTLQMLNDDSLWGPLPEPDAANPGTYMQQTLRGIRESNDRCPEFCEDTPSEESEEDEEVSEEQLAATRETLRALMTQYNPGFEFNSECELNSVGDSLNLYRSTG